MLANSSNHDSVQEGGQPLVSRFWHAMMESSNLLVSVKDGDGRYLYANPRFVRALGLEGRFQPGLGDAELFPEAVAAAIRNGDAAALSGGASAEAGAVREEHLALPGGARVFLASRTLLKEGERPAVIGKVALEVTGYRQAEADILASQALFKGILDLAVDAVISIDEHQRIILFNRGAEQIFGYKAREAIGQPLDLLLPPTAQATHGRHIGRFQEAAEPSQQMGARGAIHGRRQDGSIFPAEASISKVAINGRLTFTAILRDVTKAHEVEAAMKKLNVDLKHRALQLENANRELEAFSYSVSHDLRAPLRSIDGFSQVILEDYGHQLDSKGQDHLLRVRTASQRMAQLIDDLLSLSRLTRGEIHRETVDLSAMARAVIDELRRAEPGRDATVIIADGVVAHADPHLVRVVLGNLLGNAWKYTSQHATARIEFGAFDDTKGRRVCFVRDDGAGFDMAYVDKLFGAFQRLHGISQFPGSGIGLATVQRIISKHGGEVWGEGAIENGATFYFTLH